MDAYDTYYPFIRRMMIFLGIWPFQDPKEQFVRITFIIFNIISLLVVEIFTFITANRTLGRMIDILTIVLPTISFSSCYYATLAHSNGITLTIKRMIYDWSHLKNLEELEIMKTYARQTRRYTMMLAAVMYGSCFFILAPPILKIFLYTVGVIKDFEDLHLAIDLEYFLDKNKYLYIEVLHQTVTVPVLFTCAFTVYSMYFIMIQHACASFRIISTPQNTDQWMKNCIERYANVVEFIDTTNTSGEMCYLWQISLSMVLISLSILHVFQLRTHSNSLTEILYNSSCIPGQIITTYTACYIGQKLINHSADVFYAACQLSYYNTSLEMQKLLLFLLMRTAKPCTLSIGKMFIFSHEFFSAAIQTSFSYAMMLYTFQ